MLHQPTQQDNTKKNKTNKAQLNTQMTRASATAEATISAQCKATAFKLMWDTKLTITKRKHTLALQPTISRQDSGTTRNRLTTKNIKMTPNFPNTFGN